MLAATFAPGTAGAAPIYPAPDPDPFYLQPPDVAAKGPGDIFAARPMPPLPLFPGIEIRQLAFRSTDSQGRPIAATTLVMLPPNRAVDAPVLSYQHIVNALGLRCAPSRALYSTDQTVVIREAPALNGVLARGWVVTLPDHLGPDSAYGAARMGGQITLDGIRAVQRSADLNLGRSPVAMAGYSGGGMATAFAAALAKEYAPELRIVGVAEGGVPMNIRKMAEALGFAPHPLFGLAMAAAIGLEREYPEQFPLSAQLNPEGLGLRDQMANACTNDILALGAGRSVPQLAASTSLVNDPNAWSVADLNSVELYPGVPNMPVFEWHSPIDGLIPVDSIDATVRRYCAAGVPVLAEKYPSPDHMTTAVLGMPAAMNYLDARFRGEPAPSNCR
nr:lipase family protein [Skermania piniformis]